MTDFLSLHPRERTGCSGDDAQCRCERFPDPHEKDHLCGIGFNQFLGEVQRRLLEAGYNPPRWPDDHIRDQGDLDSALDSLTQWCKERLDELAAQQGLRLEPRCDHDFQFDATKEDWENHLHCVKCHQAYSDR